MRKLAAAGLIPLALSMCTPQLAPAHEHWAGVNPAMKDWYQQAELTPAAQKRLPWSKCCAHADVVRTQFRVNKTDGGDEWFYLAGEVWKRIPPDIIHTGESAPDGQPTLFIYTGIETCFYPGEGGI